MSIHSSPSYVAAVVLTLNEHQHIAACLETLGWADRRIVFDSFSNDGTVEIARACGAEVIQHPFENYAQQRNAALACAREAGAAWVFFVDADERCTPPLAEEVQHIVRQEGAGHDVWAVPRHNYLFGRLTLGAGWYPDYQARLFRVGKADFEPSRAVHEVARFAGEMGRLQNVLLHYNYETVAQFHAKQRRYAALEAGILFKQGVRPKVRNFFLQPAREFRRRFFALRGYVDGLHGLRLSVLMAYYTWFMYRQLAQMWQTQGDASQRGSLSTSL
ncbi:MAG: glycosyltransferase family 2 protein [Anaerolineae bacterium]|nr:glycosyltransferase family 2 protein [Thermoflexales bacterium]MDW8407857.1 glycosyltransferase family 2 protein [Anaerolineae bacterium]